MFHGEFWSLNKPLAGTHFLEAILFKYPKFV